MARPKVNPDQHLMAYNLYRQEQGLTVITKTLAAKFKQNAVSERTVGTWIRRFKSLKPPEVDPDEPFQWHRLDEYSLHWESSGVLLDMWRKARQGKLYRYPVSNNYEIPAPTVRQVKWWSRLLEARPELDDIDVWYIAQRFVTREIERDLWAEPLYLADLEAWIAYHCCATDDWLAMYESDVEAGIIPALIDPIEDMYDSLRATDKARETNDPIPIDIFSVMVTGECPYLLPSKQQFQTTMIFEDRGGSE